MRKKTTTITKREKLRSALLLAGAGLLLSFPNPGHAQYGLYGFGAQDYGQVGNGTIGGSIGPNNIPLHTDVSNRYVDISGGHSHTLAVKEDGSLWAWGRNNVRQLGNPGLSATVNYAVPQLIDNGQGSYGKWSKVFAVGISSSFAIAEDSSLWAWGNNGSNNVNRLGIPGTPGTPISSPTQVLPGSKWLMVCGGDDDGTFTIGLRADSTLWSWGQNAMGQLGTGNTTTQTHPVAIMPTDKWSMVTAGNSYVLAIRADGSLWGWGLRATQLANTLGDGSSGANTYYTSPQLLDAGTGVNGKWVMVSSRNLHSQAIREDGSLWGWGQNTSGRIGDGNANTHPAFRKMIDPGTNGKWSNILAGHTWSLGIKENNQIYVWGEPVQNQPHKYNTSSPQIITEAGDQGTLVNGRIFTGRQHAFWINEYLIVCPQTTNRAVSQITINGATITWDGITNAESYDIAIDQSPTAAPAGSSQSVTGTTYTASGLASGTTYYVHIRSSCGLASYSVWDTISFTTTACLAPLDLTVTGTGTGNADLSWSAAAHAAGYEVIVDPSSANPPSGTPVTVNGTSYNATGLTSGTTYYAFVRTRCDAANTSDWEVVSFNTQNCETPVQIETTSVRPASATIKWNWAAYATGYQIVVDQDPTPEPTGVPVSLTDSFYFAPSLSAGTTYYAHVRTNCGDGNYSDWDTLSFTTLPECLNAENLKVENITSVSADISWNAVVQALEYEIAIDQTPALAPAGPASSQTATSFNATQLEPGTKYTVHLRSNCGSDNYSAWDTLSFTTESPGSVRQGMSAQPVRIYPNPVKDVLYIDTEEALHIRILNLQGQEVFSGSGLRNVQVNDLPAGVYILHFSRPGSEASPETLRFLKSAN